MSQINFFFFFNIKKIKKLKSKRLSFSTKLYLRVLSLTTASHPRVIFIILIIILNLHEPSLSKSDFNTIPKSFGCGSGYKFVS
jgi:hypothetical protein